MNKFSAALLGIALLLPIVSGCDPQAISASDGIVVMSVKLEDWTNPKDGKQYLVALPTWKNVGRDAVRQVSFWPEIKGSEWKEIDGLNDGPTYHGDPVEPGTIVAPVKTPQDGVILGTKKELKDVGSEDVTLIPIASTDEYKPMTKSDT